MAVVMLETTTTVEAAVYMSERWLQEQRVEAATSPGHVFTYTDASGLPAEVYGP
jgi:hypothetical protein